MQFILSIMKKRKEKSQIYFLVPNIWIFILKCLGRSVTKEELQLDWKNRTHYIVSIALVLHHWPHWWSSSIAGKVDRSFLQKATLVSLACALCQRSTS